MTCPIAKYHLTHNQTKNHQHAQSWTDESQKLMLLAIIHLANPPTPNWDEVATLINQGFTGNAIRQQYQKLRKEAKTQFGDETAPATPKKTKTSPAAGKKRKAGKETEIREDNQAEGEDVVEDGAKKVKVEDQEEFV